MKILQISSRNRNLSTVGHVRLTLICLKVGDEEMIPGPKSLRQTSIHTSLCFMSLKWEYFSVMNKRPPTNKADFLFLSFLQRPQLLPLSPVFFCRRSSVASSCFSLQGELQTFASSHKHPMGSSGSSHSAFSQ